MKKSEIKIENVLEDLDKILNFVDKIDGLDLETSNLKQLKQESKDLEKKLNKKYSDHLDPKK